MVIKELAKTCVCCHITLWDIYVRKQAINDKLQGSVMHIQGVSGLSITSYMITLARPSTSSSLRITDRSFQYMLPLVSGINSRLLCVNHALISPIRTHLVLWVALSPSVPSTYHSHHPSPLHSFIPVLKPSILQILPTVAFLFFFTTYSTDSLDCLPTLLSTSVFYFLVFLFSFFSSCFRAV